MPFKFSNFCELLNALAQDKRQQGQIVARQYKEDHVIVKEWFDKHDSKIERSGPAAVAFLSAFFPERRPDRTYNLQDKSLNNIFGSALGLGSSRLRELQSWQRNDGEDFAVCVRRVMSLAEIDVPLGSEVTLEELDAVLTQTAANTISSAPQIRALATHQRPTDILTPLIRRLTSNEAEWFVRMIRKSYSPVQIPEYMALHQFHFILPKLLEIQNNFEAAINTLSIHGRFSHRPVNAADEKLTLAAVARDINPVLGTMIRRQPFWKARSIKHCIRMAENRTMSIERKYDGEYCQIHVDMTQKRAKIQIFSKNGRDATSDRLALHDAIKAGLRLDRSDCKIKRRAILEGELLVFSTVENQIMPFHHVRKHVRHGGRRIGTEKDSPRKVGEHPMIVFYDLLLLDDDVLLAKPHKQRRALLKGLVTPIPGCAHIVERVMIDTSLRSAPGLLRTAFGTAIRNRWEGFVLKGLEDPYFDWGEYNRSIKLKKDYIGGLGDSVDLCVIGGCRNPRDEMTFELGVLAWTSFHVAALVNKDDVRRFQARPIFQILDCLGPGSMSKDDILALNSDGRMVEHEYTAESEYMVVQNTRTNIQPPTHIFKVPLVIELTGAGYERPQSADFWILRFPRRSGSKMRVHRDRGVADTVSFDELQAMAQGSMNNVEEMESQEDARWIERLLAADPKSGYNIDKSQSTGTPRTLRSETTIDLTPAFTARSTSQQAPVMVRTDSEELTAADLFAEFAESCPNLRTPSRHSDITMTPSSSVSSRVSKHDFADLQDSPSPKSSRKRQRGEFEQDLSNSHEDAPLILSDVVNSSSRQQHSIPKSSDINRTMAQTKKKATTTSSFEAASQEVESTSSATSQISPPRRKRIRTESQGHYSSFVPSTQNTASAEASQSVQALLNETANTPQPENATSLSRTPTSSPSSHQTVQTLARQFSQTPSFIFTGFTREPHEPKLLAALIQFPTTATTNTSIIIKSLDLFLTQVTLQSRISLSSSDNRVQCAAFFHFSDPQTAVRDLRDIAHRFTVDTELTKHLLISDSKEQNEGASILICDADRLPTVDDQVRTGILETSHFASGVMKISKKLDDQGDTRVKVKMFWKDEV